jgi:hypothetical protein
VHKNKSPKEPVVRQSSAEAQAASAGFSISIKTLGWALVGAGGGMAVYSVNFADSPEQRWTVATNLGVGVGAALLIWDKF